MLSHLFRRYWHGFRSGDLQASKQASEEAISLSIFNYSILQHGEEA